MPDERGFAGFWTFPSSAGGGVTQPELPDGHLAGRDRVMRYPVRRFAQPVAFAHRVEAGLGGNSSSLVRYSVQWPRHAPAPLSPCGAACSQSMAIDAVVRK